MNKLTHSDLSNPIQIARQSLLAPTGLEDMHLERALNALMQKGVDCADLYFQVTRHESWSLEDGIVKDGSYNLDQGVGARAMAGEKTGFAYSDELALPALMQASAAAGAIARSGQQGKVRVAVARSGHNLYAPVDPIASLDDADKVALLQDIDRDTRKIDSRIKQVMVNLAGVQDVVLVCSSDGVLAADVRPLVRLNVSVIVEDDGKREQGYSGGGGRFGYEYFLDGDRPMEYAREAVSQALVNLDAIPAPAGEMIVVLGPGWPGVLLHEAIGHGLEGDFNRKGTSAFSGRIGEQVASELCTVVDDGTLDSRRGSLNVDDEGMPTQHTVLIEQGKLSGYMQDSMNARLMGVLSTGNGRRQSFAHLPLPRMTNTFMLAGASDPEEIIASVDKGIYAQNFAGGQVDITSGKFVFSTSASYLIEGGKLGAPVKGASLIGDGPSVLHKVSMVGNDLQLDTGIGICGKDGQSVPVGVGQPTLRVDGLTVGGTG
ncbi:MAG: metalloprotease TldD [Gammaproteobacteria bacterium]|jgi:TldD protein|nr:metalloprotease TldD [Chromatiales bacterium]MCP4926584.1 metalloprotease TldD [Gammaproteobacteria bacterium]MDP7154171.1 metalloprotease TldD [Gammaproteobacteria bacterium]MDP7419711.1 metalloprotease TldD [Gammaproteobacteria bacterium]MDP7661279.1 metalloprotease TldD [Gammaproteobacteria bacterium]